MCCILVGLLVVELVMLLVVFVVELVLLVLGCRGIGLGGLRCLVLGQLLLGLDLQRW